MSQSLIIVESPAKARTLKKFLGARYQVLASVGHVRDLPKSRLGVDIENGFAPTYVTIKGKGAVIKELRGAAKKAKRVYLATDPDREGEAIAWHIAELLKLPERQRIELHEITKRAAEEAIKHPSEIKMDRVEAQQARRILDRLVGYQISPLLWRKVRSGLSAGRVQSVAVKLIVDREREINAFNKREYWTIHVALAPLESGESPPFTADLVSVDGVKPELAVSGEPGASDKQQAALRLSIAAFPDEAAAAAVAQRLRQASYRVKTVKRREVRRNPAPPFTTSTLQQEASRRLKMRVRRTMQLAQALYEGVDVGPEGGVGLITYMRTDSTRLSEVAQTMAGEYIQSAYGPQFHAGKQFKVSEAAQDAHEAIRPTDVNRTPNAVAKFLEPAQLKIYRLVWERFVASQMSAAVYDQTTVDIEAGGCGLRATGSVLKFAGYTAIYEDTRDEDDQAAEEERKRRLPQLEEAQALERRAVEAKQHFTEPPPRYTEATLVKNLEERGIGRPSTYATIVETIQARGYVKMAERRFAPEEIGYVVTDMLGEHFPEIVSENFTSEMERRLDRVEEAHDDWTSPLRDFYGPFAEELKKAEEHFPKVELEEEPTDEVCVQCGRPMRVKLGRFGKFLACSGYPECKTTKPIIKATGVNCPQDGGRVVERRSRRGRIFYGCENYPKCNFVAWDPPLEGSACKVCGAFLVRKQARGGAREVCSVDAKHDGGVEEPNSPDEHAAA